MQKLIVNADDFGWSEGVNLGIVRAHREGFLTSTTLMANMVNAEQAVSLAGENPDLGVGVHLNLLEGTALADLSAVGVICDSEGHFRYSAGRLAIGVMLSEKVRRAVEAEVCAQIEWIISRGLRPTHIDSHKHVHAAWGVFRIVRRAAEKYGIKSVRIPYEPGVVRSGKWPDVGSKDRRRSMIVSCMARSARSMARGMVSNDILLGIAHTGKADEGFWRGVCEFEHKGIVEVMVHPGYTVAEDSKRTRLTVEREAELEALCNMEINESLRSAGYELVHYGQI